MKQRVKIVVLLFGLLVALISSACSQSGEALVAEDVDKAELTLYCGVTMLKPMTEIAEIIEEQQGCRINIESGGSGNLLEMIRENQYGDLFLPGSDSYINTAVDEGLVSENTVHVGYNKAALMVQEGNPLDIGSDLSVLTDPDVRVIIGDPESGSIGREAKKILEAAGIYEEVVANVEELATDSNDMILALKNGEADVILNWYAVSVLPENEPFIDVVSIDEEYGKTKTLVLGMVSFSENVEIVEAFMDYASSAEGQALFEEYGLYTVQ